VSHFNPSESIYKIKVVLFVFPASLLMTIGLVLQFSTGVPPKD